MRHSGSRVLRLDGASGRLLSVLTAASFLASTCVFHSWRAAPLTEVSVQHEKLPERSIRVQTAAGQVNLDVTAVEYPFVEGRAKPGDGEVLFDVRRASRAEAVAGASRRLLAYGPDEMRRAALVGELVRFLTNDGPVTLRVTAYEHPFVRGKPRACPDDRGKEQPCTGVVRLDLRDGQRLEVLRVDAGKSVGLTLLGIGVTLGALILIIALTKESCPFVYVDRGHGLELVGEAYAGAAFRSLQRDDLLPLPAPGESSRYRVVLRNEARETQYTDAAELVVVDHPPGVRAVATFDGRPAIVGPESGPMDARDLEGRDVMSAVAALDNRRWEREVISASWPPEAPLREGIVAHFAPSPAGARPVLEIVGGNTPWLDLVFGRFFASMGDALGAYQARWSAPEAGPGLLRWKDREGVDLRIETWAGDRWTTVALVPTVGPVALRRVAVPLPVGRLVSGQPIEVRLSGGTGFWRIDRLSMAEALEPEVVVHRIRPLSARAADGADVRERLAAVDRQYHPLERLEESLDLDFELPVLAAGAARSVFLWSNGYYSVHPPLQGHHSARTVQALQREPGALGRFSRELAVEYQRRWVHTPRVAEARP